MQSVITVALFALVGVGVAGCSGSGADPGSTASAARSSPGAPPGADAGLLTGSQLKALLLPVTLLPKGYAPVQEGTTDSGELVHTPSTTAVDLAGACQKLTGTSWIRTSGIKAASFAQADFQNPYQEEFHEEIDSFRGTDAQTVMDRLQQIFAHCAHFTDTSSDVTAKVRIKTTTVPAVGDQTIKAVLSAPQYDGGETLVATRVGNLIITTFRTVQSRDMGSASLDLTKQIAARITHAHQPR